MKSWLAQGSSGRRVTLLPGTTFLHINGALNNIKIGIARPSAQFRVQKSSEEQLYLRLEQLV